MKKVTIILGPRGSGKTTECKRRCEGKKSAWYEVGDDSLILKRRFDPLAEIVVLEEVTEASWPAMLDFVCSPTMKVGQIFSEPTELERPEVIITSQNLLLHGLDQIEAQDHVLVIKLGESTKEDKLKAFAGLVFEMRDAQKAYFTIRSKGGHTREELAKSKALEKRVDEQLIKLQTI